MLSLPAVVQVVIYGIALWLGVYLINRNPAKPRLLLTGLGLMTYSVSLALDLLAGYAKEGTVSILLNLHILMVYLPPVLWSGVAVLLLPEDYPPREIIRRGWAFFALPVAVLMVLVGASTGALDGSAGDINTFRLVVSGGVLALLLMSVIVLLKAFPLSMRRDAMGIALLATLFFCLGVGLWLFPLGWIPRHLMLLGIGIDLLFLGGVIAVFDAFDEGEALRQHMVHSFDAALLAASILSVQVVIVMALDTGATFAMMLLLLLMIATGILWQTMAGRIQFVVDRVVFGGGSRVGVSRQQLRSAGEALSRMDETVQADMLDEQEFTRLTRRALSHFNDLPRLASSPLTRLPLIDARLSVQAISGDTLERAAELRALLMESIERLKPRGEGAFGTSDAWRFYNALYFPYVQGVKPYSRRFINEEHDDATREALAWFRSAVPERTLYNWQTAAAALIAQDIREQQG